MTNYFGEYYNALDRGYGRIEPSDRSSSSSIGAPLETSTLGPGQIGVSTNPMMHATQAFSARIREGTGKIEIGFMGAGKSNSQQPSPEAFGSKDRRDIRELAEINDIRTSVHAPLHGESLAGLGREGFSGEMRHHVLEEIERAIHFASEATRGGAVVFHTGEWNRPMTEIKSTSGVKFSGYEEEAEKAVLTVVDKQTGNIQQIRKDYKVYEPDFYVASEYESQLGRKLVGTRDANGEIIEANDWIDMNGNAIKKEWLLDDKKAEKLFNRVPKWNTEGTNFKVKPVTFQEFEKQADELRAKGKDISPEELFFKSQYANKVLQSKGASLFHAQSYERLKETRDAAKKALLFYEQLEKNMPEDEKWKIMLHEGVVGHNLAPPKSMTPAQYLREEVERNTNQMRHIHESSAAADAQAREFLDQMNRVTTVEKYGLEKSAETIAKAGIKAMQFTDSHKKELKESIYVAPENWRPEQYGSHPEEMRKLVTESRKTMAHQLMKEGFSAEEAKDKAKEHIKATLDIGHFNMWRQHFEAKTGESPESRNKRFDKWLLDETQKLAKEGIVGHIHLADNFGYDDEHLTPGEGNVPMKEFIKKMEDAGLKDFVVEQGGFNINTTLPDTWSLMGSPIYATGRGGTFRGVHNQHFGYINSPTYIVGAYAPSNEWHLWSEVPME